MNNSALSPTRLYFHRKLFLYTFFIIVIGSLCGGIGIFAFLPSSLGEGYGKALQTIHGMEHELLVKIIWLFVVMAIFFIPAISFLLMFYSHRIAGPAFRLGREANLIAQGNLKADFRLRSKDNLADIEDALKQVAVRYRDTVSTLKKQAATMETQAESISGMVQQGKDRAALESALEEISGTAKKIDTILSEVRIC